MSIISKFRANLARAIAPDSVRRLDGAGGGRRFGNLASGTIRNDTSVASPLLRPRARNLAVNNPWASNGIDVLVTGLVGTGIVPTSTIKNRDERRKLQATFRKWAKTCDADGLTDYYGMQAAAARGLIVDGEAFIHMAETNDGLKLRLIPPEWIQSTNTSPNIVSEFGFEPAIMSGIEFGADGQRTFYHVRKNALSAQTLKIPAADMIHLFLPLGAGQVRGTSWLASVILKLNDLDGLEDALLMGFKVAALHAGFLTNLTDSQAIPYDGAQKENELETSLEPGTIKVLPAGTDIKFNSPQQANQATDFAALELRAVAAGMHVPEFLLTGDMRGANYSSMRSALIAFRQYLERIQFQILVPQMLDKVWARAMFLQSEDLGVEHYPPALPWVDPLKDVEATQAEIEAGLISRRQAVARRGYDIEELDDEIAMDQEREKTLGLNFKTPTNNRGKQNANPQLPN